MNLHAIEARLPGVAGGLVEIGHDPVDLGRMEAARDYEGAWA
jgi:hypothetical protein